MTPDEVRGSWDGSIAGTNTGRFRFVLTVVPGGLVAHAVLDDNAAGSARLVGTAKLDAAGLHLLLVNDDPTIANRFGTITVTAILAAGALTGTWQTTAGTSGTFEARRASEAEA